MAFPVAVTSVLTGATPSQLRSWSDKGLVVPEVRPKRPPLYSYRDLVLLRTMVFLRSRTSLQRIGKAFYNLNVFDLTEHPSSYRFGTDGTTIFVEAADSVVLDLVARPGQIDLFDFDDISAAFSNFKDEQVVDFRRPAPHITVRPQRLGGWPTIEGSRVGYDVIAQLVDDETVTIDDVPHIYPSVSTEAAASAVAFDERVRAVSAA